MNYSTDIETEIYEALYALGYSASAHAVPATLGVSLPHIHVTKTGGTEADRVLESSNIDFDVYADDAAEAMESACVITGAVRGLEGDHFYSVTLTTLPYNNPDPRHSTLARATFKALIYHRTKGGNNA